MCTCTYIHVHNYKCTIICVHVLHIPKYIYMYAIYVCACTYVSCISNTTENINSTLYTWNINWFQTESSLKEKFTCMASSVDKLHSTSDRFSYEDKITQLILNKTILQTCMYVCIYVVGMYVCMYVCMYVVCMYVCQHYHRT